MRNKLFAGTLLVALVMLGNGFLIGYHHGTGEMPKLNNEPVAYLPPEVKTNVPATEVITTVEQNPVSQQSYRVGYNCLDFAWDTMRNLSWQGIPSYVAAIGFEDGTHHAVVAIPTSDAGLMWYDPQGNIQLTPEEGKVYMGKRVDGLLIMHISWLSIDEFANLLMNPADNSEVTYDGS